MSKPGSTTTPATPASAASQDAAPRHPSPPLASVDLLKGERCVEISHNGLVYRLQATRLGKLILTK